MNTPTLQRQRTAFQPRGVPARGDGETGRRPWGLVAGAGAMAAAAVGGAVGLIGGGIDFGPVQERLVDRLPFHSTALAGSALLVAVALPMGFAASLGWRRNRAAGWAGVLAGTALVGWIAVEFAVIRTYSWMQPVCAAYGGIVGWLGWRQIRGAVR